MFSGIVPYLGEVVSFMRFDSGGYRLILDLPEEVVKHTKEGSSIAVNGVCLTAYLIENNTIEFGLSEETVERTTLKPNRFTHGTKVHIEPSLKLGDEIGGHIVSGHVDDVAEYVTFDPKDNSATFKCDPKWMEYMFHKGFIALDGASLTVNNPNKETGEFVVYFIEKTLQTTQFRDIKPGSLVNMEIDRNTQAIVETTKQFLKQQ